MKEVIYGLGGYDESKPDNNIIEIIDHLDNLENLPVE